MDHRRFDALARALASSKTRRAYAAGALGLLGIGVVRNALGAKQIVCPSDGEPCTMMTGCCEGFTCVTSALNPNVGTCQAGGTGGVEIEQPIGGGGTAVPRPTNAPKATKVPKSAKTTKATKTPKADKPTPTPKPAKVASVLMRFDCGSATDQWLKVDNTGDTVIQILSISPLEGVPGGDPSYIDATDPNPDLTLQQNDVIKFRFGQSVETPGDPVEDVVDQPIFDPDAKCEGAILRTVQGVFRQYCTNQSGNGCQPPAKTSIEQGVNHHRRRSDRPHAGKGPKKRRTNPTDSSN